MSYTTVILGALFALVLAWFSWFLAHYFNIFGCYYSARFIGLDAIVRYDSYYGLFQKPCEVLVDETVMGNEMRPGTTLLLNVAGLAFGCFPILILHFLPYLLKNDSIILASALALALFAAYVWMGIRNLWSLSCDDAIGETDADAI